MAVLKFLLLSLRPISKAEPSFGWWEIFNVIIDAAYPIVHFTVQWPMNWFNWAWLAGIPAILFLIAGIKLQWRLDKAKRQPKPFIVYSGADNVPWPVQNDPWFVRAYFANDPPEPQLSKDAYNVIAQITFYRPNGESCFRMNGRWAGKEEIAHGAIASASEQITLPANGRSEPIDIGLKYHDEDGFYGYDNMTQAKGILGWRDKDKMLCNKEYFVQVVIRGSDGVYAPFWFSLRNDGIGKEVNFSPLSSEPDFRKEDSQTL
jgi:hypothetical protein